MDRKTEMHQEPTYYGDDEETTETISLYIMFEGDLRPTLLTNNTTRYSRKAETPRLPSQSRQRKRHRRQRTRQLLVSPPV